MTEVIFREARRDDVPAIVAMLADDTLGSGRETVGEDVDAAYWRAFDDLQDDPRNVLVVDFGGEVVGTMQLTVFKLSVRLQGGPKRAARAAARARAGRCRWRSAAVTPDAPRLARRTGGPMGRRRTTDR